MRGVYALKHEDEIIYVGMSSANVQKRINHHFNKTLDQTLKKIGEENGNCNRTKEIALKLYMLKHSNEIESIILFEADKVITKNEIQNKEKEYIELYQPKFNYVGVLKEYKL